MKQAIKSRIESYPPQARIQFDNVRRLILNVARENQPGNVEETLKWGEPAYLVVGGSTIRLDWKAEEPEVIKLYFHCQTTLIETFREIYRDDFLYDGNRAIVLPLDANLETESLSRCISMALRYHSLKHLELLGA